MQLRSKRSITAALLAGTLALTGAACGGDDDAEDVDVNVTEDDDATTGGTDATTTGEAETTGDEETTSEPTEPAEGGTETGAATTG